jgi:hypothetical protein
LESDYHLKVSNCGFSPQRQFRLIGLVAENVWRYASGPPLGNVVDKQRAYR